MASNSARLLSLKASKLKTAAFLMGLPSAGTKTDLDSIIRTKLSARQPFNGGRVLSVDMGIRNLAFCVLDMPPFSTAQSLGKERVTSALAVSHWFKKDLLAAAEDAGGGEQTTSETVAVGERESGLKRKPAAAVPKDAFTPSALSKTAYAITTQLLSYKPTVILIERQRFRSGGSAAILEWTVRVNMLESMLWACLQTLRESRLLEENADFPTVLEVSPRRVASFWTTGPEASLRPTDDLLVPGSNDRDALSSPMHTPPRARRAVRKSDKIAIARFWLDGSDATSAPLAFGGEAAKTAHAFRVRGGKGSRGASGAGGEGAVGKLDDLADCLLQAVAWVRWEENSRRVGWLLCEGAREVQV
ncbi:hypothetical protein LTR08_003367 [Meristemomyces frigidus]|nr:hypothetical protein LTR08_003367 [Meristemomyces frigidus]